MARTDIKVFIASGGELQDERDKTDNILAEINRMYDHLHLMAVKFEKNTASGNNPGHKRIQDKINPLLDECDIVLAMFHTKVGEFTLEEFNRAIAANKKVFLYLKEGYTPSTSAELIKYGEVIKLKEEIEKQSNLRYQKFKTLTDFNTLFYNDLLVHCKQTYPTQVQESKTPELSPSASNFLPIAPRPYLAHPYALPQNFTGRTEEMRQLTEWLKFEKEPMCIVEAIGGMGKSALTWKWLQDEVIAKDMQLEGIVWWSFYDQGFEDFVHHLYEYCVPESRRKQQTRIDELTEVITTLANHRFLLVLDGFERVLRGYAQMMAMYIQEQGLTQQKLDAAIQEFDVVQRTPITPKAEKLLKALCAGHTKTLITSRLFPATIEGLSGVKYIQLTGLSKTDTIAFFKSEGIQGTEAEMIKAGAVYSNHPLMLKLLCSSIKRSFTRDIGKAFSGGLLAKKIIDEREPKKILTTSFKLLNKEEQKVATTISVFRTAFKMDAAHALFPKMEAEQLEATMREVCNLGFVMYNASQQTFDFHPIMRAFLYDSLTAKDAVHDLALSYFSKLPAKEKIITLADLEPAIEQYHHLVRAKKYDEAFNLYWNRLGDGLFYQLAQYNLIISLMQQLFANQDDELPALKMTNDQSILLNELGLCYARSGQLDRAGKYLLGKLQIDYDEKDNENLASGFLNVSEQVYAFNCRLTASMGIQLKGLQLVGEEGSFKKAYNDGLIGDILSKQGWQGDSSPSAISHYEEAFEYCEKEDVYSVANGVCLRLANVYLAEAFSDAFREKNLNKALEYGRQSFYYAEIWRNTYSTTLYYFSRAYEAMSKCLLAYRHYKTAIAEQKDAVYFYDEHFQNITGKATITQDNYFLVAERIVHEGLTLSRKINEVFRECTFLLLLAQAEWLKIRDTEKGIDHFTEVIKAAEETKALATRIGYRINLADLHLFCAECLIEMKELQLGDINKLLNLTTEQHLVKAREYSRDMSEYNDLFLPPDGSADEFYKDIPEYEMLKRGMTEEERVKNGYYVAWLKAERLETRLSELK